MEVWRGVPDAERPEPLFDGELSFTVPRLVFGSSLGAQLSTVETGRPGGWQSKYSRIRRTRPAA